jgi:hypothetical protein
MCDHFFCLKGFDILSHSVLYPLFIFICYCPYYQLFFVSYFIYFEEKWLFYYSLLLEVRP